MLRGAPHDTCGGRWLDCDLTEARAALIATGARATTPGGVDGAGVAAARVFPYLAGPILPAPPSRPLVGITT
jgi:hypothetical protein